MRHFCWCFSHLFFILTIFLVILKIKFFFLYIQTFYFLICCLFFSSFFWPTVFFALFFFIWLFFNILFVFFVVFLSHLYQISYFLTGVVRLKCSCFLDLYPPSFYSFRPSPHTLLHPTYRANKSIDLKLVTQTNILLWILPAGMWMTLSLYGVYTATEFYVVHVRFVGDPGSFCTVPLPCKDAGLCTTLISSWCLYWLYIYGLLRHHVSLRAVGRS